MGTTKVGTLVARSGVFALADTNTIETQWTKAGEATAGRAVDIRSNDVFEARPVAEYLAKRQGQYPTEKLADGTWRILCPDQTVAGFIFQEIQTLIAAQGWHDTQAEMVSVGASVTRILDGCRLGSGIAKDFVGLRFPKKTMLEVYETRNAAGEIVRVELIPVPVK